MGERLLCKQEVIGSIPIRSMNRRKDFAARLRGHAPLVTDAASGMDGGAVGGPPPVSLFVSVQY